MTTERKRFAASIAARLYAFGSSPSLLRSPMISFSTGTIASAKARHSPLSGFSSAALSASRLRCSRQNARRARNA